MKIIKIVKGTETYLVKVDDIDYPMLRKYIWTWRHGYAATLINKKYNQMHRMLMGVHFKDPILIDHRDNDHCNNQRFNLRRADNFQNQQNRKTNIGNSLPKGIRQLPSGKYNVRVQSYNSRIVFGAYDTLEEAVEARNAKAAELHGEFLNPSYILDKKENAEV